MPWSHSKPPLDASRMVFPDLDRSVLLIFRSIINWLFSISNLCAIIYSHPLNYCPCRTVPDRAYKKIKANYFTGLIWINFVKWLCASYLFNCPRMGIYTHCVFDAFKWTPSLTFCSQSHIITYHHRNAGICNGSTGFLLLQHRLHLRIFRSVPGMTYRKYGRCTARWFRCYLLETVLYFLSHRREFHCRVFLYWLNCSNLNKTAYLCWIYHSLISVS